MKKKKIWGQPLSHWSKELDPDPLVRCADLDPPQNVTDPPTLLPPPVWSEPEADGVHAVCVWCRMNGEAPLKKLEEWQPEEDILDTDLEVSFQSSPDPLKAFGGGSDSIVDEEWISPGPDPAFQVIPDQDPTFNKPIK